MSHFNSMFWRSIRLSLAPLALSAVSCADPSEPLTAAHVEDAAFAAAVAVPMKITGGFLPVGSVDPPPPPCLQMFKGALTGTATHLGSFKGASTTCILNFVAPDPNPPWLPPGPPPYATATISNPLMVLTAADGDELWLTAPHARCVLSLADSSLRCEAEGQPVHFIIGGTGRFAAATGELVSHSINADGQGPDDFEYIGWIRF